MIAIVLGFTLATATFADAGGTHAYDYDGPDMAGSTEEPLPVDPAAALLVRSRAGDRHFSGNGYDDPSNVARASARLGGYRLAPNTATRHVIGGMEALGPGSLRAGEATVASRLPGDAGNRLGNWLNNRDVLRSVMREGQPIRDASVDSAGNLLYQDTRRFITLERDFLRSHRWAYDPSSNFWMPPG